MLRWQSLELGLLSEGFATISQGSGHAYIGAAFRGHVRGWRHGGLDYSEPQGLLLSSEDTELRGVPLSHRREGLLDGSVQWFMLLYPVTGSPSPQEGPNSLLSKAGD